MEQNSEQIIYIEYLISKPLISYPVFQLLQVKRLFLIGSLVFTESLL